MMLDRSIWTFENCGEHCSLDHVYDLEEYKVAVRFELLRYAYQLEDISVDDNIDT